MYTELWEEVLDGVFDKWDGLRMVGGASRQPNIGDLWSDEELADVALYRPVVPSVPAGKVATEKHVERVGGVVTFVYVLESVPLRDLNRIQFEFMIEKLGIGPAIEGAIAAMPEGNETEQNAKILARVLYRSGQNFERTHPLFSELAPAIGFTSQQVDAAWLAALSV